jgi:hypothetical protein
LIAVNCIQQGDETMKATYQVGQTYDKNGSPIPADIIIYVWGTHIANEFPKFVKAYDTHCHHTLPSWREPITGIRVQFYADQVNKGKNETGIKRLTRFIVELKKNHPGVEFVKTLGLELPSEIRQLMGSNHA